MGIDARKRKRPSRNRTLGTRRLRLGYYYIVTDAKETEKNYLQGLKDSLPDSAKGNIEIHVDFTSTKKLVGICMEKASLQPQNRIPWVVLDRDRVESFDEIIKQAEDAKVCVAWSNPCIEVWLGAYFVNLINKNESQQCVSEFGRVFQKKVGHEYDKADPRIYVKIFKTGDEARAIKIAKSRHHAAKIDCKTPSQMCPCTTMYQLIDEIKSKVAD